MPLGFSLQTADQCFCSLDDCVFVYSTCRVIIGNETSFGIDHWALRN